MSSIWEDDTCSRFSRFPRSEPALGGPAAHKKRGGADRRDPRGKHQRRRVSPHRPAAPRLEKTSPECAVFNPMHGVGPTGCSVARYDTRRCALDDGIAGQLVLRLRNPRHVVLQGDACSGRLLSRKAYAERPTSPVYDPRMAGAVRKDALCLTSRPVPWRFWQYYRIKHTASRLSCQVKNHPIGELSEKASARFCAIEAFARTPSQRPWT